MTHPHVESPHIPLNKEKHNCKLEKYSVKLKLRRDPAFPTSDLYEFKIYLLENGELEKFFLFVRDFNANITASGMLEAGANYQYLHTLVRRK